MQKKLYQTLSTEHSDGLGCLHFKVRGHWNLLDTPHVVLWHFQRRRANKNCKQAPKRTRLKLIYLQMHKMTNMSILFMISFCMPKNWLYKQKTPQQLTPCRVAPKRPQTCRWWETTPANPNQSHLEEHGEAEFGKATRAVVFQAQLHFTCLRSEISNVGCWKGWQASSSTQMAVWSTQIGRVWCHSDDPDWNNWSVSTMSIYFAFWCFLL